MLALSFCGQATCVTVCFKKSESRLQGSQILQHYVSNRDPCYQSRILRVKFLRESERLTSTMYHHQGAGDSRHDIHESYPILSQIMDVNCGPLCLYDATVGITVFCACYQIDCYHQPYDLQLWIVYRPQ